MDEENLTIYSIVNTLTELIEVNAIKIFLSSQRLISFFLLGRTIKICTLLSPSAGSAALESFVQASLLPVRCAEERLWHQRAYTFSIGIVPAKLPSKQNNHTDLHFP